MATLLLWQMGVAGCATPARLATVEELVACASARSSVG